MKVIVSTEQVLEFVGGLSAVLGDRTSASAVLSVPLQLYTELLGTTQEGQEDLTFSMSLTIVPDTELLGSGGILTVT